MTFSKRHLAILALIVNSIIWGAAAPIFKWTIQDVPPFTLAFLRFLLAALILLPFVFRKIAVDYKDFHKLLILAFLGIFVHISSLFVGLQFTSSINVPIISAASPIVLIFGSLFYLKEKPQTKVLLGTMLSLMGVIFIVVQPLLQEGPDQSLVGNLLFIVSMLAMVAYTLLLKKFNLPYSAATIIFWLFLFGAMMFAPFFYIEQQTAFTLHSFDIKAILGVLYGAVLSSIVAYLLYDYGVTYMKGSEIGIFGYIEPIVTILVAIPLLGEVLTTEYLLGSIFVFAGIIFAEGKLKYHPLHHHHLKKEHQLNPKEH
jgi:drug/metabolite transporter (DMT)-like permease